MKKWILFAFLASSSLFAEEQKKIHEQSFYLDVGSAMLPIPVLGAGFRTQSNHIGFDASIKSAILIMPVGIRENASILYYPTPNLSSQYYLGAGFSASQALGFWYSNSNFFGPNLSFGNSYRNSDNSKRFWQVSADFYLERTYHRTRIVPVPVLFFNYGFCF